MAQPVKIRIVGQLRDVQQWVDTLAGVGYFTHTGEPHDWRGQFIVGMYGELRPPSRRAAPDAAQLPPQPVKIRIIGQPQPVREWVETLAEVGEYTVNRGGKRLRGEIMWWLTGVLCPAGQAQQPKIITR